MEERMADNRETKGSIPLSGTSYYETLWEQVGAEVRRVLHGTDSRVTAFGLLHAARAFRRVDGKYLAETPIEVLYDAVASFKPTQIIDFGAGAGDMLAELVLTGVCGDARTYAIEPSQAGCATAATIFGHLAPYNPPVVLVGGVGNEASLNSMAREGRTLIYTHHSIEQVHKIPLSFWEAVLGFNNVLGIHMEPFGFQMLPSQDGDVAQERWIRERGWNVDLWPHLSALENHKFLRRTMVGKNWIRRHLVSPTSIVIWRRF